MPTTYAIPNGRTVMDATTYTGTGANRSIVNSDLGTTGFQPDLVWVKRRDTTANHILTDSVRGANKQLLSSSTNAESSDTDLITGFNSNGFNLGISAGYDVNVNGGTYVGWQWQAGQGTNTTNTQGSITSTVSVNASAGFSIVTYTGTGSAATIGHGLGVAPSMIICKVRSGAGYDWHTYHSALGATKYLSLNLTDAAGTASSVWNNTAPTSSVFSVANNGATNLNGGTLVAYCWSEIAGFSKFGSYTGNGSADGPFVYTGFRPSFVLIKNITNGTTYWEIYDNARNTYNVESNRLYPNASSAESTGQTTFDFLSNGLKVRSGGNTDANESGSTIIYAAFAENPFKYANAR